MIPNENKTKTKTKNKIFKVVNPSEEVNFMDKYSEEEVQEFINQTNIILEEGLKKKSFQ